MSLMDEAMTMLATERVQPVQARREHARRCEGCKSAMIPNLTGTELLCPRLTCQVGDREARRKLQLRERFHELLKGGR